MPSKAWLSYEQKRAAFERKYRKRLYSALMRQARSFAADLKAGRASASNIQDYLNMEGLAPVLLQLYREVGGWFAKDQAKEIKTQLITSKSNRYATASNTAVLPATRKKFLGALNFNQDYASEIADRLRINGLNMVGKISDTSRKKLLALLSAAQEQGLSLDDTVRLILTELPETFENRAFVITRTEVGRSANEGKVLAAQASGYATLKKWVTAGDNRVRPQKRGGGINPDAANHMELNGKSIELDEDFKPNLGKPGDKRAPASEVIQCRCVLTFKLMRDAQGNPIRKQYILP